MECPNNHDLNQEIKIGNVKIDRCGQCHGLWFKKDELRQSKDFLDEYSKWFDIDLWQNEDNFRPTQSTKTCPVCAILLFELEYGDSKVVVDACKNCHGVWLDKNEFRNIIDFVQKKSSYNLLNNYTKSLIEEGKEIFTGPENLGAEISDFLIVLKLLQFKIVFGHPALANVLTGIPFTK